MRYTVLIDGEAGGYGVVFPDLPGCTAMGDTVEQALASAARAAQEWITMTLADQQELPPQRSAADVVRDDPEIQASLAEGAFLGTVLTTSVATEIAQLRAKQADAHVAPDEAVEQSWIIQQLAALRGSRLDRLDCARLALFLEDAAKAQRGQCIVPPCSPGERVGGAASGMLLSDDMRRESRRRVRAFVATHTVAEILLQRSFWTVDEQLECLIAIFQQRRPAEV